MSSSKPNDGYEVIVFPRGQLSPKDKERLTKHGIVAVEADDPKSVHVLAKPMPAIQPVAYDDMIMSLFHGIRGHMAAEYEFSRCLHDRLKLREKERETKSKAVAAEGGA